MNFQNRKDSYHHPFGVTVEFDNTGIDGPEINRIWLMTKDTDVLLNKEEVKELLNVIQGKKCQTLICREADQYEPHTLTYFTAASPEMEGQTIEFCVDKDWNK